MWFCRSEITLSSHLNDSLTGSRIGRVGGKEKNRHESANVEGIIFPQNFEVLLPVCSVFERADTTLIHNPLYVSSFSLWKL